MTIPLLSTKLFVPSIRPREDVVQRPRLTERLNAGLRSGHKLTLIAAPAGFGKTTLVSEWVYALGSLSTEPAVGGSSPPVAVAWLSLDKGDNDPTRFLAYVIAALQTPALPARPAGSVSQAEEMGAQQKAAGNIGRGALSALHSPQPQPKETILTALINDIAASPDGIVLVLDDYHLIETQPIHKALTFLLEHMPPQMQLLIATREDPHLPLARLRARGQFTELRAADLRFTPSEAADFLNRAMGLDLSENDIATLDTRTEGWIAGLKLAAVSIQGHQDTAELIQSFSGSHRFVLDYLIEEVLKQQPESVQRFLLQTAILERLTGSLCDAVRFGPAGTPICSEKAASSEGNAYNGQAILEMLERANLFIIPLDEERQWYRYHHLFSDLLRQRLHQTHPAQVSTLHRRASEWYEQHGFADEAIEHALRTQEHSRALHLIEQHADGKWTRGEHADLRRWLDRLPIELLFAKPQLSIFHAWYLFARGQQDAGERSLRIAEEALEFSVDHDAETPPLDRKGRQANTETIKLRGRAAAVRASMASYRGDVPGIIQHASRALDYLPEQDVAMRSAAAIALGNAYGFRGDMAGAYQARMEAVEASTSGGNVYFSILAHLEVAITLREQGRLQRTIEICRQQVQAAAECGLSQSSMAGCLLAIWGEVLAEQGDLAEAQRKLEKGVVRTEGGDRAMLGWSYVCLMRVLLSAGEFAAAQKAVHRLERIARESDIPPWITNQMATWQARLWLASGKLEPASDWARERALLAAGNPTPPHEPGFFPLIENIVLARILIAEEQLDQAIKLLQHLIEAAEAGERTTRVIEMLNLQALAHQARADIPRALAALEKALTLAKPERFFGIFVDEGPPMARLLGKAAIHGIAPEYARRMLAAFPVAQRERVDPSDSQTPKLELVEPLSEREQEVLQLISEGLTNPEIASRLFLSLNTVKAHTRSIYGKLDVHSRTQAVARSQALGLLPHR